MNIAIPRLFAVLTTVAVTLGVNGCAGSSNEDTEGTAEHEPGETAGVPVSAREGEHARSERGEHDGQGGESHDEGGEDGEEPGVYIGKSDTWDTTRRGVRLVLTLGRVENTTEQPLCAVRVEVHLAGGVELGPTERTNVPAGGTTTVRLPSEGQPFGRWTAHPEMSSCTGG